MNREIGTAMSRPASRRFRGMARRSLAVAIVALYWVAAFSSDARAACPNPVNPAVTTAALRAVVAGTWFSENHAPNLGMVQRMYQSFHSNGNFEYQDETCGRIGSCSKNGGHGVWSAIRQHDGTIYVRIQFSDLRRTNECTGFRVRFPDQRTMSFDNGTAARRVR